jgi:hypothetical protein
MRNTFSGLVGSKVVVVMIGREDIERRNTVPAVVSLNKLVESLEALAASNGTISLMVGGYDNDPRELHMIPEVRDYFKALDEDFPYWFHICTRIEHSLRLLFLMLADLTPVANPNHSGVVSAQIANDDLNHFVNSHFEAMDSLHGKHGFPQEENQRITGLVVNYFESLLSE